MTAVSGVPAANGPVAAQRPDSTSGSVGDGRGTERWTADTEELLARTEYEFDERASAYRDGTQPIPWSEVAPTLKDSYRDRAEADLEALADAGLLVTPGGDVESVWRSYDTVTGGSIEAHSHERASELVVRDGGRPRPFPQLVVQTTSRTTWPDGSVNTGPWIEVDHA